MHTVKLAIRLVRKHTINNGTMSIKRMLDILDIGYYEPAGAYQAPKEFTSPEMSFQIHLKHQTQQKNMLQLLLFEIFIIVSCHRTCHISGSLKQWKLRNHLLNYLMMIIGLH